MKKQIQPRDLFPHIMGRETISCSTCDKGSCALTTLSKREVGEMESHTRHTRLYPGEMLLRQETPIHSIIYLRTGFVKEYVMNETSSDQIVQLIKPRSYIGLQSLFTNDLSAFSYLAISEIEVCYIDQQTFSGLIRGNGDFAQEILIALSNESLNNHKRILGLNRKQTYGKVADMLIYLSQEVYESDSFSLMLSRTELSQMIASTRESVTKALLWFQREGMIQMDNHLIRILDPHRILEMAQKG